MVAVVIAIGMIACTVEYQALRKYYPNLTFKDYLILHDKLRITPG